MVNLFTQGDVPDLAIRLIAAVVILIVTAINVYGVKAATQIQVWNEEIFVCPLVCYALRISGIGSC